MKTFLLWFDRYTDALQHFLAMRVVLAPLLLLLVEEAGIPLLVPGDAIVAYTGYEVSISPNGATIWEAFVTAQLAVVIGSTLLFFLARRWGKTIIDKLAQFIFLKQTHVKRAEQLFAKYGILAIIIGRHIPGMRIPITIFAATSGVRYYTFIVATFISTSTWILFFLSVGRSVAANFHQEFQRYVGLTLAVIALLSAAIVVLHIVGAYRRARRVKTTTSAQSAGRPKPKP